ncbi:MAG TPA: TonB-dependent receptor [Sphingomonas sp.]|nr:TonB-dependent receptor [Sphingomonas sp.]
MLGAYYSEITDASRAQFAPVPDAPVLVKGNPRNTNKAVFGQATYKFGDVVELVAGIRYNKDRGWDQPTTFIAGNPLPLGPVKLAETSATTGKLGVNLYLDDDNFVYAVASKGYRAGGTNLAGPNFGAETIHNYEAGYKATLLDRHLRLQLSGFYNRYSDVQLSFIDPVSHLTTVQNGNAATVKGFEAQGQLTFGGLRAYGNLSLLDTELGAAVISDNAGNPVQVSGHRLPLAPNFVASVGAEYEFPVGDEASLTPRVQFSHMGGQYASAIQSPADLLPAYDLLNASLTLELKQFQIMAFVNNLTDELYLTGAEGVTNFLGARRQYGVKASVKF